MRRFRTSRKIVLSAILVTLIALPVSINVNQSVDSMTPVDNIEIAYVETSPFNITHNDNFTSMGFPGSGTIEDPYRIENLSIAEDGDCIDIRHTDAHFVISRCYFDSVTREQEDVFDDSAGSGVFLLNVSNCKIVDSFFYYKYIGCEIYWWSTNIAVLGNHFSYCFQSGVFSSWASHCDIVDNSFSSNRRAIEALGGGGGTERSSFFNISDNTMNGNDWGIEMNAAESFTIDSNTIENGYIGIDGHQENVTITNNLIDSMSTIGIYLSTDSTGIVTGNTISNIAGTGIYLGFFTGNLTISYNEIEDCSSGVYSQARNVLFEWNNISFHTRGVQMQNSEDCIFKNNLVSDNDWYGLDVSGYTYNNSFYYNTFVNNVGPNARDRGGNNTWDDGVNRGNVWDDYIGLGYYIIPDRNLGVDRYPDNPEHGLQFHVILPPIGIGVIAVVGFILLYQRRELIRARLKKS